MAPFLAMAKLERARFCTWLIESVVFCCLPCSRIVTREACRFHFMVPFLAMAKLERARFCAWLIESVVTSCKSCIGCFSYSTGVPTCSFVNKKSSAISKKVSISRGNLPKKGTFPRLIDMFFSSDTKPIVSCYGHARLDQHLPLPVFSPANALDQAFLL